MTDPHRDLRSLAPEEALDALRAEAEAGRTNAWLAERADVSTQQVAAWRRKRGIEPSPRGPVAEQVSALQGLAKGYDPARHRTAEALDFETPAYLLRQPLDYSGYARACFALLTIAQFSTQQIARATGTRERDVEIALQAWRRHLTHKGRRCLGCQVLVDPDYGAFCSTICHQNSPGRVPRR